MKPRRISIGRPGNISGIRFLEISQFSKRRRKQGSVWLRIETGTHDKPKVRYQEMRVGDSIGYDLALFRENAGVVEGRLQIKDSDTMRMTATLLPGEPT